MVVPRRRRCRRSACVELLVKGMGARARKRHHDATARGVDLSAGREDGMNQWTRRPTPPTTDLRTLAEAMAGRRRVLWPVGSEGLRSAPGHGLKLDGGQPDHLRHAPTRIPEITPEDVKRTPRVTMRSWRPGVQRLPEPGQQRPGLPIHLPWCPGRPRQAHQRRDEDRRCHALRELANCPSLRKSAMPTAASPWNSAASTSFPSQWTHA